MNAWKLVAPRELQKEECPVPEAEEGKIRVRVTKMMLSRVDAEIYQGNVDTKLPMIPGKSVSGGLPRIITAISTQTPTLCWNHLSPKQTLKHIWDL